MVDILIGILTIYAFISLITSLISLLGRKNLLKAFCENKNTTNNFNINDKLQILEMALFIMNPLRKENQKKLNENTEESKKMLSLIKKIKDNKMLEFDEIKYISDIKYKLKLRLNDLIRLDSAYIFINLIIILFVIYIL